MGLNRDAEMGLGGGNHMSDNFCSPFSYPVSVGFRIADFALGGKHTALLTGVEPRSPAISPRRRFGGVRQGSVRPGFQGFSANF